MIDLIKMYVINRQNKADHVRITLLRAEASSRRCLWTKNKFNKHHFKLNISFIFFLIYLMTSLTFKQKTSSSHQVHCGKVSFNRESRVQPLRRGADLLESCIPPASPSTCSPSVTRGAGVQPLTRPPSPKLVAVLRLSGHFTP